MIEVDKKNTYRLVRSHIGTGIKNSSKIYFKKGPRGGKYYKYYDAVYTWDNPNLPWNQRKSIKTPVEDLGYKEINNPYYGVGSIKYMDLLKDGYFVKRIFIHYDDFPYSNVKLKNKNLISLLSSIDLSSREIGKELLIQWHNSKNKKIFC